MRKTGRTVFKPGWIPTVAVVLIVPVLLSLGFWQLDRADEKRVLIDRQKVRQIEPAIRLMGEQGEMEELRYRNVEVSGRYDTDHQFLIDNQVANGVVGFYVFTPLRIDSSRAVLVNRGWIPMGRDRAELPDISLGITEVDVTGMVDHFPSVGYRLQGAEIPTDGWPSIVQVVDEKILSDRLGYSLLPYQILLDPLDEGGYLRQWKTAAPRMTPEKHVGYAFQWFALTTVLVLFYLWRGFKSGE
jgi:surfeit locus 1 family protein